MRPAAARTHRLPLIGLLLLAVAGGAHAQARLPAIFGDHMVLQCRQPAPVWGWAQPGAAVVVELGASSAATRADAQGRFRVNLPPLEPGGPFDLIVREGPAGGGAGPGGGELRVRDVLCGEVWVCAGGSNMIWPLHLAEPDKRDAAAAQDGELRLCTVTEHEARRPPQDVSARWQVSSTTAAAEFSAVGWHFGRVLRERLGVPVGLVCVAVPFSRIEPWIPVRALADAPALRPLLAGIEQSEADWRGALRPALPPFRAWLSRAREALAAGGEVPPMPACPRDPLLSRDAPTALCNGMILPMLPFAVRGVLWYQGEQNVGDGARYGEKLVALIRGWRTVWGQEDLPFGIVQLAPFRYGGHRSTEKAPRAINPFLLPEVWEAQADALSLDGTGLIVTTDLGELDNLFPLDKRGVGERLAAWALRSSYGQGDAPAGSPLFRGVQREERRLRVRFTATAGGLATRDGQPPTWFEISAANAAWLPAQTALDGDDVLVWSDRLAKPVGVRFGWHQECQPNLVGGNRLPAAPFRATCDP